MRQVSQRKDANHDEIVDEYRKQRCAVVSLARVGNGCPDLLVFGYGRLALVEVKLPKAPIQPCQEAFMREWPVTVVRSKADVDAHVAALRAVTVDDLYRVDRSAVERQLGHPIKALAPWNETEIGRATKASKAKRALPTRRSNALKSPSNELRAELMKGRG